MEIKWTNSFGEEEQTKVLAMVTHDGEQYAITLSWRNYDPNKYGFDAVKLDEGTELVS